MVVKRSKRGERVDCISVRHNTVNYANGNAQTKWHSCSGVKPVKRSYPTRVLCFSVHPMTSVGFLNAGKNEANYC